MSPPRIAGIVLAAGRSSRMGSQNKLLLPVGNEPMVRHAARAAQAAGLDPVVVVTGHMAQAVSSAVDDLGVTMVANPDYAEGLSTSLRAGLAALPADAAAAVILLGDMPAVTGPLVSALVAAAAASPEALAAVPVLEGAWGNPVLVRRALFADLAGLRGDAGARKLLEGRRDHVVEVTVEDPAVALDVDTPDAFARLGRR